MSNIKILIAISLFFSSTAWSAEETTYTRDQLKQFAKSYVEQDLPKLNHGKYVVTPADIDPRITLKPCASPLVANIPKKSASRNVHVKISCASSMPWQIFLPVKVETHVQVLTTTQKISKGTLLDSDNITLSWLPIHKTRGQTFTDINSVIGAKAKRSLNANTVLSKSSFCLVCKGDAVTISAKSADFMIKTDGVALSNGSVGQQIKVKNKRSGRTISAQVQGVNQVVIAL